MGKTTDISRTPIRELHRFRFSPGARIQASVLVVGPADGRGDEVLVREG